MSYDYWQDFVLQWQAGHKIINGWSNPDGLPLYNDPGHLQLASGFIPEPWWGNDGSCPLHSIIINYNPGQGQNHQRLGTLSPFRSYASNIVNSGVFPKTDRWHCNRRAMPILDSLNRLGIIGGGYGLNNHLSIELIPWHTSGISQEFWTYIEHNIVVFYSSVLFFAAQESMRIANPKLNSVVLLRMSGTSIGRIIKCLDKAGFGLTVATSFTIGKAKFLEFSMSTLPSVRFIGIWGSSFRNNMPSRADLDAIISII